MIRIRRDQPGRGPRLELSPLAMVLFALVAVFVLGGALAMNRRSLPVNLSEHSHGIADVVITVSGSDTLYWNSEGPLPIVNLSAELMRRRPSSGYKGFVVGGDRLARFGDVVRAYDEVRAAGETRVTFDSRVRETPGPKR